MPATRNIFSITCLATLLASSINTASAANIAMPQGARQWIQFSGNFADEGLQLGGGSATGGDAVGGVGYIPNPSPNYHLNANGQNNFAYATGMNDGSVMRSSVSVYSDGFLYNSMYDTYTVSGGSDGESVTVEINFHIEGELDADISAFVQAEIGTWNASTVANFNEQFRVNAFDTFSPDSFYSANASSGTVMIDHLMTYELEVTVGEAFDIAYGLNLTGFRFNADFSNTASISVEVPEGYSITSELTAVPLPATLPLLLSAFGFVNVFRKD